MYIKNSIILIYVVWIKINNIDAKKNISNFNKEQQVFKFVFLGSLNIKVLFCSCKAVPRIKKKIYI